MSIQGRFDRRLADTEIDAITLLLNARHHNPFQVLGLQRNGNNQVLRLYRTRLKEAYAIVDNVSLQMRRIGGTDLFELNLSKECGPIEYEFEGVSEEGERYRFQDPYHYTPLISDEDLTLFNSGEHVYAYRFLGAHLLEREGVSGAQFAVWAPNAERVSVVADFNSWDGRIHQMRCRGQSGVWELFVPGVSSDCPYKYEIRHRDTGNIYLKADPFARQYERRPDNASITSNATMHQWRDENWMQRRRAFDWLHKPISIYELHLGSWLKGPENDFLNYRHIAKKLVNHVLDLGFTHVQLLPVTEHPFDASWGYQVTGYFAPTSRFGSFVDFAWFVDYLHQHDIGVFVDWVPAHFPKDDHALAKFDGSTLYEHNNPLKGEQQEWGTLVFDYGRNEVQSFLLSSATFWLEECHIDGLRVDAVASMLYLDYSRPKGAWQKNQYGGNENLEAIAFLRRLNEIAHARYPGALIMAEESTAWPGVSRPTFTGGLGFSMKWNMGWMNDTLAYMSLDPIYRQYHHEKLTFSQLYAYTENFILPLSHDEVVHSKKSLISKMPGDQWQQFANLRLLYAYLYTLPGKKLLFMGAELAQYDEWDHQQEVQWPLLDYPYHRGVSHLLRDLNTLYRSEPSLYQFDFEPRGFHWINCHDHSQSVLSYQRLSENQFVIVVLNFTPVPRFCYQVGVTEPGRYQELLNTDATIYGGSNLGNAGRVVAQTAAWGEFPYTLSLTLPPLGALVLKSIDTEKPL